VRDEFLRAVAEISAAEWVAVAFAFAYVLLAIRQNAWCWFTSIVSSAIFLGLFARAGLPMQAWLQGFYIAMAAYGAWAWRRGAGQGGELPVSRWPVARHAVAIAVVGAAGVVNGAWVAREAPDGLVPYVDALTAWFSVFATWLVARKVIENWLYWIVADLVAAALYWSQGLFATSILFVAYALLAVSGYRQWREDLRRQAMLAEGEALA
jgi:nicotinamide mononucleotide transporter